jgi:hypothetical protein
MIKTVWFNAGISSYLSVCCDLLVVGCAAWANSMHKMKQHVVKRQNNNSINRFASCMIV